MTVLCYGNQHQDSQNKANQEVKRGDINLDTVFQIADEVMQTPANSCLVKVQTPERPGPVSVLSSNTPNPTMCYSPASVVKANPCAGPIIMSVTSNAIRDAFRQEEESVVSVPEQMPEDDIFEVSLTAGDFLNVFTLISSEDFVREDQLMPVSSTLNIHQWSAVLFFYTMHVITQCVPA